jgi:hypothetical protein
MQGIFNYIPEDNMFVEYKFRCYSVVTIYGTYCTIFHCERFVLLHQYSYLLTNMYSSQYGYFLEFLDVPSNYVAYIFSE